MTEQLDEYQTRLEKLHALKAAGIIPYANRYEKVQSISDLKVINDKQQVFSDADKLLKE